MSFTEAWAETQVKAPANVVDLPALEFLHPSFVDGVGNPTPVRVVGDLQDHTLLLEDFAPFNPGESVPFQGVLFELPWPEIHEGQVPELQIRVDNVSQLLQPYLDAAVLVQAPITVVFRIYQWDESTGLTTRVTDPINFKLRSVTVTDTYVQGAASPADLANLQFLRVIYDTLHFPALSVG